MIKIICWVVVVAIVAIGFMAFLGQWHNVTPFQIAQKLEPLHVWVKNFGLLAPIAYVFLFVLRPLALLPSALVTMLGGLLFGVVNGVALVLIGAGISGSIEFVFIRHFANPGIKNFIREKAPGIANATEQKGFLTVFLVRVIPNVAFDLQNCALALTPVKFSDYLWGTLAGCFPAIVLFVVLGNQALTFIKAVR